MKKTIFALLLMLASAVTIQAQNLTRTAWTTMVPGDEELEMVLNFDNDGECYIILTQETFEELEPGSMTIRVSLSVPGIYNQDGRDITLSFNKKKADFNISYEINGVDRETKAMYEQLMRRELKKMEPQAKRDMLECVPAFMDDMRVISVSKTKLILGDSTGEKLTFYPTAKG